MYVLMSTTEVKEDEEKKKAYIYISKDFSILYLRMFLTLIMNFKKRSNKIIMSLSTISTNHITETILSIY